MTEPRRPNDNWELEEGGDVENRWVLQESEQRLTDQWQLQEEPVDEQEWQPVEYVRPERSPASFVLPGIVTIALLAVLGYTGYVLLPRFFPSQQVAPTPTIPAVVAGETATPGPPEEPTAVTPVVAASTVVVPETPAVPTEEPEVETPTEQPDAPGDSGLVDVQLATVNSPYGVNARIAPNTDAEIIRILNQGEIFFVLDRVDSEWLQLFVNDLDTQVVEGQPISGTVGYAASEFMQLSNQLLPADFVSDIRRIAGIESAQETPTEPLLPTPTPTGVGAPDEQSDSGDLTITINATSGLNIRSEPSTEAPIIALLEQGVTRPVRQRTVDGAWVQIELADGALGWAAVEFVTVNGDLNQVPAAGEPNSQTAPAVDDPGIAATDVITTGGQPGEPYSNVVPANTPAIIVTGSEGVNGRVSPNTNGDVIDILPQGAAVPIRGRSADGAWLQVELPFGRLAWVFADAVNTVGNLDILPITDGTEEAPAASANGVLTGTATVQDIFASIYPVPSTEAGSLAVVARGTALQARGRNPAGDWVQIQAENGAVGWIRTESVQLDIDIANLPLVQTPVTP